MGRQGAGRPPGPPLAEHPTFTSPKDQVSLRRSDAERDEVLISAGELLNEGLQRGGGGQASAQPFTYTEFSDTHLNKVYFYAYDHLGNTRVTYSQDCKNWNNVEPSDEDDVNIEYAADYYPYGKVLREFVNERAEKYLTTLHQRDEETGLDYRGARYYDSDIARFLSLDPKAREFASWSPYSYVLGNPISLIDPDGRAPGCGCPNPPCPDDVKKATLTPAPLSLTFEERETTKSIDLKVLKLEVTQFHNVTVGEGFTNIKLAREEGETYSMSFPNVFWSFRGRA